MIGPKSFLALAVPLTLSLYSLFLNIFAPNLGFVSIWISRAFVLTFGLVSVVYLLRVSEKEEEKLVSDHMNIRE